MKARGVAFMMAAAVAVVAVATSGGEDPAPAPAPDASADVQPDRSATRRARVRRQRRAVDRLLNRAVGEQRDVIVRVSACRGGAASGAAVKVLAGGATVAAGEADERGVFTAHVPKDAAVRAVVVAGPYEGGSATTKADELAVNVCPGATVEGRVVDPLGRPLAGVEVELGDGLDVAVSDADGLFVLTDLDLAADRVVATGPRGRGEVAVADLKPGEVRRLDVTLQMGRQISGWVVDHRGDPVSYAQLVATNFADEVVARERSDRSGRFWLKELPMTPLVLTAQSDDGGTSVHLSADDARDDLVITLGPTGSLVVSYVGAPPASFSIVPRAAFAAGDVAHPVATVGVGVAVTLPAPGSYVATYERDGETLVCGTALLTPGNESHMKCGDEGTATVSGRAVDKDGAALAGVTVQLHGDRGAAMARAVTDDQGRFVLEREVSKTQMGRLVLHDRRNGFLPTRRRNIPLVPGEETAVGDLRLDHYEEMRDLLRAGPFTGIGAQIAETDEGILLRNIVSGGPIDRAGLAPGDVVVAIDDAHTPGFLPARDAVRLLRGPEGSALKLRVKKANGELVDIDLIRTMIDAESAGWVN